MLQKQKELIPRVALVIFTVLLATSVIAAGPSFVPRPSPEFTISPPSGKSVLLSSLKGKVVVMEFFPLQSNHCIRVATMLNKLNTEMGNHDFQALGVVFDPPNVQDTRGRLIGPAADYFKLTYPVGYASKSDVDGYLDRKRQEILNIPQIIVIDRKGIIRAASGGAGGDPRLEDEGSLRSLIENLINERTPNSTTKN